MDCWIHLGIKVVKYSLPLEPPRPHRVCVKLAVPGFGLLGLLGLRLRYWQDLEHEGGETHE